MKTLFLLAGILALAACGQGEEGVATMDNRAAPETGATAQVARLDEGQRNGVLEKAIRAAGAPCPSVSSSERAEISTGVMGWKAHCDDGTAHLIQILSDGTAKVTSRIH
ncbi:MAG TPA: hypothetical protein VF509_13910 [Sphingobium sp.]